MDAIKRRRQALLDKTESTSYSKQKSSLEKELSRFLVQTAPDRDITMATPDDVVNFLIWKDRTGKTVVHEEDCVYIGKRSKGGCSCPKRLAFGTVDSLIGKLRSIFADWGRTLDDSAFPGYGNPAASRKVKSYLTAMREEQLLAGVVPAQAEPLFITDLAAITQEILRRLKDPKSSPIQIYLYARDQAFFKTQFFAGDRAGDLSRTKTKELLYFPGKEGILFNNSLTKSLRDGTANVFALKRYKDPALCPITAIETYIKLCDLLNVPVRDGLLFRATNRTGDVTDKLFDSVAAQARLSTYVQQLPGIFGDRRVTLHGMRSGCAISLALSGVPLESIMAHVGWKTAATAKHYIKLNQVMAPGGVSDILACLAFDLSEVYQRQNSLTHFTQAF